MDANGDIVLLATEMGCDDNAVQDQVIKLSTSTGSVTHLVDFGELFADYKASTTHAGTDESDSSAQNRWDWLHCNTIQLLDDGSALFSARETSTIIKVDDLESDPTLDYMIGEPSVWAGTDEVSSFLTKDGDFSDTGGQHSITYIADDLLPDGQYYLYMFDNNFGTSLTRPDFDWTMIDGISTELSSDTAKRSVGAVQDDVEQRVHLSRVQVRFLGILFRLTRQHSQILMGLESELLVGVWVSGLVSYATGSARPYNGQHGFFRFVVFIQASRGGA